MPSLFSRLDLYEGKVQQLRHDSAGAVISGRPHSQVPQFASSFQPPVPAARKWKGVVERLTQWSGARGSERLPGTSLL